MAGKLRHIAVGNNTYDLQGGNLRIFYGTCTTGATAQIKIVNIPEVAELETGDVFYIKMANAQTYNGIPKLQINSFAEKNIARTGSDNASRYEWQAGEILEFLYDGTSMVLVDGAIADTTFYGLTKLSSAVDSNSEAVAATSKAVKTAYDAATTPVSGATATKPGAAGIVPQPVAGDQVKFLRGDGTWVENSGSVLTVNNIAPDVSKNVQLNDEHIPSNVDGKANVEQVLSHHSQQIDTIKTNFYKTDTATVVVFKNTTTDTEYRINLTQDGALWLASKVGSGSWNITDLSGDLSNAKTQIESIKTNFFKTDTATVMSFNNTTTDTEYRINLTQDGKILLASKVGSGQWNITELNTTRTIDNTAISLNVGTLSGNIGVLQNNVFQIRLFLNDLTLDSVTNIGAFNTITSLIPTYLSIFSYSRGRPINGGVYMAGKALTYYGEAITDPSSYVISGTIIVGGI